MDEPGKTSQAYIEVWKGIGLTALLHLLQIVGTWLVAFSVFFIGLTQLVYIIPAILLFHKDGRPGIVKGLVIGAAITFLLNAACFGYIFVGGMKIGG